MLKPLLKYLLIFIALFAIALNAAYAEDQVVSSRELISNAKDYDQKIIVFEGEVIGEVMQRKNGAWVNVNDGDYSIGIWMPKELANKIQYAGGYKTKGDIIRLKGLFNHACLEHGGDLDIHAVALINIKPGYRIKENFPAAKKKFTIILFIALCLILISKILIPK